MGGGLMAVLAKYEELDDAQEQIEQLQVELRRFKTEPVSYTHLQCRTPLPVLWHGVCGQAGSGTAP